MQYVVHAYDYPDEEGLSRRMAARPAHFERARKLKADGQFVMGGALLDERQGMIGSMMVVDFGSEEELQAWLREEPYVVGRVWERIDVRPFRMAEL